MVLLLIIMINNYYVVKKLSLEMTEHYVDGGRRGKTWSEEGRVLREECCEDEGEEIRDYGKERGDGEVKGGMRYMDKRERLGLQKMALL